MTIYEIILRSVASGKVVKARVRDSKSPDWAKGWAAYDTREDAQARASEMNKEEQRESKNVKYSVRAVSL